VEYTEAWSPHQSILRPLLFIIHINDPPQRINAISEVKLFADDTSVIFSVRNFKDFCLVSYSVLTRMIKWFAAIKLAINLDKNKCDEIHNKEFITF
jgi:hypothetical protein